MLQKAVVQSMSKLDDLDRWLHTHFSPKLQESYVHVLGLDLPYEI